MKFAKQALAMLLALVMLLGLATAALAEEPATPTITITQVYFHLTNGEYAYGKSIPLEVHPERESSAGSSTFAGLSVTDSGYYTYDTETSAFVAATGYFTTGVQYFAKMSFTAKTDDGYALSDAMDAQSVSFAIGQSGSSLRNDHHTFADGLYTAYFELPMLENALPLAVPFKSVVKKGGNVTPPEETFELEVLNAEDGSNLPIASYTLGGTTFTTNGAGTTEQQLTIKKDDFSMIIALLNEGIVVREKNNGTDRWTYDDTAWLVTLKTRPEVNSLTDGTVALPSIYDFGFRKATLTDNGWEPIDQDDFKTEMTFTNTYTKNTSSHSSSSKKPTATVEPEKENPGTGAVAMPLQTVGSLAGVVLVAAAAAYARKKHMK